jgi:3-methylcrotonyl-CoA carboxylase alpha subunit
VISVAVEPGQAVHRGDVLLVLEAMKVQMRLTAPRDGVVAAVNAVAGELVDDGAELIVYATTEPG